MEYYNFPATQEANHIDAFYLEDASPVDNQIVEVQVPFPFCETAITDDVSYYQQFNDQPVVIANTYPSNNYPMPMLSPPIETSYIDLETYDVKPIISPEFQHSEIFPAHPSSKLEDDHSYVNPISHQEIERPDLKIMIPTAEDIKPFVKSQPFPPSPPTSPPTPHISSASNDSFKPKKITSINVENEDVKIVKQEDEDSEQDQNELPTYVNPKQYERILKRRIAREKFQKKYNISKERKPYIHQSRHNHAVRRLRGPGGRFLSATETAEMDRRKSLNSTSSSCVSPTTPVSSSPFFNVPDYTYINSNEHFQTMLPDGYLIGNNDSWNPTLEPTSDLCKNDNFPNILPAGNIMESYIQNSNMYENYPEQTPSVIYLSTPINDNNYQGYY